jgi:hypothetical protein
MEKTTVYLPIALKSELKILSRRANQSEAETIREALSQYVEQKREPRRLPKSLGGPACFIRQTPANLWVDT